MRDSDYFIFSCVFLRVHLGFPVVYVCDSCSRKALPNFPQFQHVVCCGFLGTPHIFPIPTTRGLALDLSSEFCIRASSKTPLYKFDSPNYNSSRMQPKGRSRCVRRTQRCMRVSTKATPRHHGADLRQATSLAGESGQFRGLRVLAGHLGRSRLWCCGLRCGGDRRGGA